MIESINVKLGGTVLTCTVEELKAFQKELNKLFPTDVSGLSYPPGVRYPLWKEGDRGMMPST